MSILKYILLSMVCIPVVLTVWLVGLCLFTAVSILFVIKGCLEAIHSRVYE